MRSAPAFPTKCLQIGSLFSLCLFAVKIESVHRKYNHDISDIERTKAQTIPEAPVSLCQINCCPPFDANVCRYEASAPLIFCCKGVPVIVPLGRAGQMGKNAGSSATAGGGKNHENNGGMNNNQGNTGGGGGGGGGGRGGGDNNQETSKEGNKNQENNGGVANNQGNTGGLGSNNLGKPPISNPDLIISPDVMQHFRMETLSEHNLKREIHNAPPLELDDYLNRQAQEWAEDLARRKTVEHSQHAVTIDGKGEGENIAEACVSVGIIPDAGNKMTDMWYKEIKKYDWNNPVFTPAAGHFTQLVWKDTQRMGVGGAKFLQDGYICHIGVVRYLPEGNVQGQFSANVLKGSS